MHSASLFRFIRFAMVGALCSAIYAIVAWIMFEHLGFSSSLSSLLGYAAAIPVSYFGQKFFAFKSGGALQDDLPRFLMLQIVNLFSAGVVMKIVVDIMGLPFTWGTAAVIVLIPLFTYVILFYGVFTARH